MTNQTPSNNPSGEFAILNTKLDNIQESVGQTNVAVAQINEAIKHKADNTGVALLEAHVMVLATNLTTTQSDLKVTQELLETNRRNLWKISTIIGAILMFGGKGLDKLLEWLPHHGP